MKCPLSFQVAESLAARFALTNSSRLPSALEPMFRMLNLRDCPLDRSLVSHEKAADEISAPEPMFRSLNGSTVDVVGS